MNPIKEAEKELLLRDMVETTFAAVDQAGALVSPALRRDIEGRLRARLAELLTPTSPLTSSRPSMAAVWAALWAGRVMLGRIIDRCRDGKPPSRTQLRDLLEAITTAQIAFQDLLGARQLDLAAELATFDDKWKKPS